MLVLSRKKDESLMIGDDIEIKVVEVSDGKVRLGIVAPKSVAVHRKEVFDEIMEENRKASRSKGDLSKLAEAMKAKK